MEAIFDLFHHTKSTCWTIEGCWLPLQMLQGDARIFACRFCSIGMEHWYSRQDTQLSGKLRLLIFLQWALIALLVKLKVPALSWRIRFRMRIKVVYICHWTHFQLHTITVPLPSFFRNACSLLVSEKILQLTGTHLLNVNHRSREVEIKSIHGVHAGRNYLYMYLQDQDNQSSGSRQGYSLIWL